MRKLLLFSVLALPTLMVAQSTYSDSIRRLDDVVVSSTRISRSATVSKIDAPLRQIPISISGISAEDIRLKGFNDPVEALRDVPSVNAYRDYGAFHMFWIRGFYESLIVSDGMRDDRQTLYQCAPITGLGSVERMEVLKGAASMQQGHSAVGGVVNIVRKQPSATLGGYARLSGGSWNTFRLSAGATGEVSKGLTLRGDVEAVSSDGWRDNYTRGINASLVGRYEINNRQKLQLSVYANRDTYGGDYGQPHYRWDVFKTSDGSKAFNRGDFNPRVHPSVSYGYTQDSLQHTNLSAALKYELRLNDRWTLSEHAFLSYDRIEYMSTDAMNWVLSDDSTLPYYIMEGTKKRYTTLDKIQRTGYPFAYTTRSLQNQLELLGKFTTGSLRHSLLLGYNYMNMNLHRFDRGVLTGAGVGTIVDVLNPKRYQGDISYAYKRRHHFSDQTHGLYAQDYIKWGKLSILAGVRMDYFKRLYLTHATEDRKVLNETSRTEIANLALTYRGGLVYSITNDINLYLSASNFYKPQRVTLSSDVIYQDANGKEMTADDLGKLPPSKGYQLELGTHLAVGRDFSLDAAVFYIDYRNKLSEIGLRDSKRVYGLINGYVSKGFEVDASYSPIKMIDLQLGYSFTDTKVSDYKTVDGSQTQFVGNTRYKTPKHRFSAWAFLHHDVAKESRLTLGIGTEHSSKAYTSDNNVYVMPAYTLLHAMASYQWQRWTLQLNANNLLDKHYTRNAIAQSQFIPGEGRSIMASLSFRF